MVERVLKVAYTIKLQDEAVEAYGAKLRLEASKKRDAYLIADADAKVHSQHAPTEAHVYCEWLKQMGIKAEEVRVLREAYDAAEALVSSSYGEHPGYARFCIQYALEHYKPTEDDYEDAPCPSAECPQCLLVPQEPVVESVSHATATEIDASTVEGPNIVGDN